jgi:hypothetical protein
MSTTNNSLTIEHNYDADCIYLQDTVDRIYPSVYSTVVPNVGSFSGRPVLYYAYNYYIYTQCTQTCITSSCMIK